MNQAQQNTAIHDSTTASDKPVQGGGDPSLFTIGLASALKTVTFLAAVFAVTFAGIVLVDHQNQIHHFLSESWEALMFAMSLDGTPLGAAATSIAGMAVFGVAWCVCAQLKKGQAVIRNRTHWVMFFGAVMWALALAAIHTVMGATEMVFSGLDIYQKTMFVLAHFPILTGAAVVVVAAFWGMILGGK